MNQVRIYHPDLDRHVTVPESAVPVHRVSGWILADEQATPPEADSEQPDEPGSTPSETKSTTKAAVRRPKPEEK